MRKARRRRGRERERDATGAAAVGGGGAPAAAIGEADYFLKAAEFRAWLLEARALYLDELPAEDDVARVLRIAELRARELALPRC